MQKQKGVKMDDLISRQGAIDALRKCQTYLFDSRDPEKKIVLKDAEDAINSLPSAQPDLDEWCTDCKEYDQEKHSCPRFNRVIREAVRDAQLERKKGKWIDKSGGIEGAWNYCSVCGEQAIDLYDFCPSCGADMRGKA